MYRFISFLFLGLTALGGFTVSGGYVLFALINAVAFLILALGVVHFLEPRFGREGLVYGMGGAFMLSLLWPIPALPWLVDEEKAEQTAEGTVELYECPPEGCYVVDLNPPEPPEKPEQPVYYEEFP